LDSYIRDRVTVEHLLLMIFSVVQCWSLCCTVFIYFATGQMVWSSYCSRSKRFALQTHADQLWDPPSLLQYIPGFFIMEVKVAGMWSLLFTSSNAEEVKSEWGYTSSTSASTWQLYASMAWTETLPPPFPPPSQIVKVNQCIHVRQKNEDL
jgi:hypothetical protein